MSNFEITCLLARAGILEFHFLPKNARKLKVRNYRYGLNLNYYNLPATTQVSLKDFTVPCGLYTSRYTT